MRGTTSPPKGFNLNKKKPTRVRGRPRVRPRRRSNLESRCAQVILADENHAAEISQLAPHSLGAPSRSIEFSDNRKDGDRDAARSICSGGSDFIRSADSSMTRLSRASCAVSSPLTPMSVAVLGEGGGDPRKSVVIDGTGLSRAPACVDSFSSVSNIPDERCAEQPIGMRCQPPTPTTTSRDKP